MDVSEYTFKENNLDKGRFMTDFDYAERFLLPKVKKLILGNRSMFKKKGKICLF
jgi:hypothetical protein